MTLKITLRPNERIIIDSAVITNGSSTSNLLIENNVPVLRHKNIMTESDADSPCKRIYFVIQLMYIDAEHLETYHKRYWKLVKELIDVAPSVMEQINTISNHVLNQDYYKALKVARKLIAYEEEAIYSVSECISRVSVG